MNLNLDFSVELETVEDWDDIQALLWDAIEHYDIIDSYRYGSFPPNVIPAEIAELLRHSAADMHRIISLLDSLMTAKFVLGNRLQELKNQWELLIIEEQATDAYKRLILTNRSWEERLNAAKLSHINEYKLLMKAQTVYESLGILIERLRGDQFFVQNYQRVLEQLVRLNQVSAILSDS